MQWCQCRSGLQPDSLPGGLEPHVSGRSLNPLYSSACFPYAERQHGSVRLWRTLHATRTPVPAQVENPRPRDPRSFHVDAWGARTGFKSFHDRAQKKRRSSRNAFFAQGKLRRFSRSLRKTPLPVSMQVSSRTITYWKYMGCDLREGLGIPDLQRRAESDTAFHSKRGRSG